MSETAKPHFVSLTSLLTLTFLVACTTPVQAPHSDKSQSREDANREVEQVAAECELMRQRAGSGILVVEVKESAQVPGVVRLQTWDGRLRTAEITFLRGRDDRLAESSSQTTRLCFRADGSLATRRMSATGGGIFRSALDTFPRGGHGLSVRSAGANSSLSEEYGGGGSTAAPSPSFPQLAQGNFLNVESLLQALGNLDLSRTTVVQPSSRYKCQLGRPLPMAVEAQGVFGYEASPDEESNTLRETLAMERAAPELAIEIVNGGCEFIRTRITIPYYGKMPPVTPIAGGPESNLIALAFQIREWIIKKGLSIPITLPELLEGMNRSTALAPVKSGQFLYEFKSDSLNRRLTIEWRNSRHKRLKEIVIEELPLNPSL